MGPVVQWGPVVQDIQQQKVQLCRCGCNTPSCVMGPGVSEVQMQQVQLCNVSSCRRLNCNRSICTTSTSQSNTIVCGLSIPPTTRLCVCGRARAPCHCIPHSKFKIIRKIRILLHRNRKNYYTSISPFCVI